MGQELEQQEVDQVQEDQLSTFTQSSLYYGSNNSINVPLDSVFLGFAHGESLVEPPSTLTYRNALDKKDTLTIWLMTVAQSTNPLVEEEDSMAQVANPLVEEEDSMAQVANPLVEEENSMAQVPIPLVEEQDSMAQVANPQVEEEDSMAQVANPQVEEEDSMAKVPIPVVEEDEESKAKVKVPIPMVEEDEESMAKVKVPIPMVEEDEESMAKVEVPMVEEGSMNQAELLDSSSLKLGNTSWKITDFPIDGLGGAVVKLVTVVKIVKPNHVEARLELWKMGDGAAVGNEQVLNVIGSGNTVNEAKREAQKQLTAHFKIEMPCLPQRQA